MSDLGIELDDVFFNTPDYGDLRIVSGDLQMTSDINPAGTDVTQQLITTRLRLFLGEFFLGLSDGVPWYQQIFVKGAQRADVDGIIKNCILETPGVSVLLSYNSVEDRANRTMTVRFTVQTSTGKRLTTSVPVSA